MALFDSILTMFILFMMFVLGYCKYKKVTLIEFFKELRELFKGQQEEVITLP